jgi:F0F1-type ATP synthase delta subunit
MFIVSLILLEVLIFFALIFMFRKIMTGNVLSATKHIEELSDDYEKKEKEIARQLEAVKLQSEEMVAKAGEEAGRIRAQTIKETEAERDKILLETRTKSEEMIQQADKSRQQLLAEINERIQKESINKACELIQNTLPEQFKKEVHSHWVEELIEDGFGQLERLRLPPDIREIKIASAFALTEEQRKGLFKKLKAAFGNEIELKEEVEPRVVAGIIVTIGSLVLDGSLKNKIQEESRNA